MRYFQSQKHTGCTTEAINNCLNCMYYSCLLLLTMLNIAHSCFHFSIYGENTLYNPNGKLTQMNFWARLLTISEMQRYTHNCGREVNKTGTHLLIANLCFLTWSKMHYMVPSLMCNLVLFFCTESSYSTHEIPPKILLFQPGL